MERLSLSELLPRALEGDSAARGELYARYRPGMLRALRGLLDQHDAEDVAQDAFAAAFDALGDFDGNRGPFRNWLFGIARNRGVDHLRRAKRLDLRAPDELGGLLHSTSSQLSAFEQQDWKDSALRRQVEGLPRPQRDVLLLRAVLGLTVEETATALDVSSAAVRQRYSRALRRLRQRLRVPEAMAMNGSRYEMVSRARQSRVLVARRFATAL